MFPNIFLSVKKYQTFQICQNGQIFENSGGKHLKKKNFLLIFDIVLVFNVFYPAEHDPKFKNCPPRQNLNKNDNLKILMDIDNVEKLIPLE